MSTVETIIYRQSAPDNKRLAFSVTDYITGKRRLISREAQIEETIQLLDSTRYAESLLSRSDLLDGERKIVEENYRHESNRLYALYEGLVFSVFSKIPSKLAAIVENPDLLQEGRFGFTQAAKKYQTKGSASLATYAGRRIWGAMMDAIRSEASCNGIKTTRTLAKRVEILKDLTPGLDRSSRIRIADELAELMGITPKKVIELIIAAEVTVVSLDQERIQDDDGNTTGLSTQIIDQGLNPEEFLIRKTEISFMNELLKKLPERSIRIIGLYYSQGKTMKEIGVILGISESRVCQLHEKAVAELKQGVDRAKREDLL
jgi:RNA polymerase sigma factor for flagellar operon FliA